jgi:hypothetical protein
MNGYEHFRREGGREERRRYVEEGETGETRFPRFIGASTRRGGAEGLEGLSRNLRRVKTAAVAAVALCAGIIAYFTLFQAHPAQRTVERAFHAVEEGNIEEALREVDPRGQLGRAWEENRGGIRDKILSFLDDYRLGFSSLRFSTRAEEEAAEVEVTGGRVDIFSRETEGPPELFFSLEDLGLVFYLEKKEGAWLIEGVNYDILELLSGEGSFPF